MKRQSRFLIGTTALILLVVVSVLIAFRSNPSKRVLREQGVAIPSTATGIECGGDAWKRSFIDCGGISTFEIPASELPAFIGTLSVCSTSVGYGDTIVPGNRKYAVSAPWAARPPNFSYDCASPTGDFLTVRTWSLSSSRVGVLLYTDWN